MRKNNFLLVSLVAITGGSIPAFGKLALQDFGPFTLVFFRFLAASMVIFCFLPKDELSIKMLLRLKWVALVGALNPICVFLAIQHLPANIIAIFYAIIPGISVLYLWITRRAKESIGQLSGFLLGLAGVVLISAQAVSTKNNGKPLLGILLVSIGVLSFFAYGILSKELQRSHNISGESLAFYFTVLTAAVSLPFAIYETVMHPWFGQLQLKPVLSVIYIGFISTGVQYLLYQTALKRMEAAQANVFIYLQPIIGVILAAWLLGETVTVSLLAGGIVVLIGARMALSKPKNVLLFPQD